MKGKNRLIIGEPNSYSSGGTNGQYVIYLDGAACGNLYAYSLRNSRTEHIIDGICIPKISNDILFWSENAPGGKDTRGYDLRLKKFIDIASGDGFQEPASIFDHKVAYIDTVGGGFGTYNAVKVKDLKTNRVNLTSIFFYPASF